MRCIEVACGEHLHPEEEEDTNHYYEKEHGQAEAVHVGSTPLAIHHCQEDHDQRASIIVTCLSLWIIQLVVCLLADITPENAE